MHYGELISQDRPTKRDGCQGVWISGLQARDKSSPWDISTLHPGEIRSPDGLHARMSTHRKAKSAHLSATKTHRCACKSLS